MVKEQRTRLEVAGSNPNKKIFCVNILVPDGILTWYLLSAYRFKPLQPVPLALFLVVESGLVLGMTILLAGADTGTDRQGYGYKILPAGMDTGTEFYLRVEYG